MSEAAEEHMEAGEEGMEEEEEYGEEAGEGEDELEAMRLKLAEMEEEAARLKEQQSGGGAAAPAAPTAPATPAAAATDPELIAREEADGRSVYIGNVDYAATPEELQLHFQGCGTVNRVTIPTDAAGNPKGFAYVEFMETEAVDNALLQDASEIRGRPIKVLRKRTNMPGLKVRGRGRGGAATRHTEAGPLPPPMPCAAPFCFPRVTRVWAPHHPGAAWTHDSWNA
ncbi:MAG: hypothetical protein J3K34DRAFT_111458 [Monoraphidium minutum]|nr:MAG: hypothetical protein J3K34DRAFT_111458 [Monoraphidium minutum]